MNFFFRHGLFAIYWISRNNGPRCIGATLSAWQAIHIKCQDLFSSENKKQSKLPSALVVIGALGVNYKQNKLLYLPYRVFGNKTEQTVKTRSDATEHGIWSGSTLSATHSPFSDTFIGSKMDLFKF